MPTQIDLLKRYPARRSCAEVAVPETARMVGRSASSLRLRYGRGVILLGIARGGRKLRDRLRETKIEAGDLLLLLGPEDTLDDVIEWLGCFAASAPWPGRHPT